VCAVVDTIVADTVLVVEYGYFEDVVDPYEFNTKGVSSRLTYNITSVGTKSVPLRIGCGVGGSSAVNSMAFMRGTSEDYDRWDILGHSTKKWDWDSLLPYFKKVRGLDNPLVEYKLIRTIRVLLSTPLLHLSPKTSQFSTIFKQLGEVRDQFKPAFHPSSIQLSVSKPLPDWQKTQNGSRYNARCMEDYTWRRFP
jgi:choline dehydrogenase-like flavoprotein